MAGGKKSGTPRLRHNYELTPGVMRFSRARMYHKRGVYANKPRTLVKPKTVEKAKFIVKPVGGAKNGKERKVLINKPESLLKPAGSQLLKPRNPAKRIAVLKKTITPGTVLIILAGKHKGKRVVFLKQLEKSGLLLVTGPLKLNNTPVRRIAQAFVIATKTKIDISGVKLPDHINDAYFKRSSTKTQKKGETADLFAKGHAEYTLSDQRKTDQKAIDAPIYAAIKKHAEHKFLFGYLGSRFSLAKNQYPHNLVF